jgi:hypothetical protein
VIPDGDSCDEGSVLLLLGDKGGRELLFGSKELGERCLELLPVIESGILTGAVSGCTRVCIGLPLAKYDGEDGDGDGENGGES